MRIRIHMGEEEGTAEIIFSSGERRVLLLPIAQPRRVMNNLVAARVLKLTTFVFNEIVALQK